MKSRKKLALLVVLALCMSLVLAACGGGGSGTAPTAAPTPGSSTPAPDTGDSGDSGEEPGEDTPTYSYTLQPASWQENGFWADHINLWAEYVNSGTDGRITVEPTLPGAIVPVDQQMDAVSMGTTGAMAIPSAYYAGVIPLGYVWATPPVVQSVADMKGFNEEYAGGRAAELWKNAIEAEYNVVVIGYMYGPADVPISSKVALNSLADLKGVKLRVGAGAIADTLTSFGASCVFAAASEAYTMLSTNAIDAVVMGSPSDNLSASFNEVTSYWVRHPYLNTTHATTMVINRDIWNALSDADRQVLVDGIEHSTGVIASEGSQKILDAWDKAEESGITLCEWPAEDQEAWARAFYETCAGYSDDPAYVEYMELLYNWSVENGYFSE